MRRRLVGWDFPRNPPSAMDFSSKMLRRLAISFQNPSPAGDFLPESFAGTWIFLENQWRRGAGRLRLFCASRAPEGQPGLEKWREHSASFCDFPGLNAKKKGAVISGTSISVKKIGVASRLVPRRAVCSLESVKVHGTP